MDQFKTTSFVLEKDKQSICLEYGLINATDASRDRIHVYASLDAINDAVAAYLPSCDRSTQERFLQILTDHIRTVDNAQA